MPRRQRTTLEIDLRMRAIDRARARQPRLSTNLRALGARGRVVAPLAVGSRPVFVKIKAGPSYTKTTNTWTFLRYLQQEGTAQDQGRAALYGPQADQARQFALDANSDPHRFHIVVSAPAYDAWSREQFITVFMAEMQRDLETPLLWVAADHYDTKYPHTHIVLRGTDGYGRDLYMLPHYYMEGAQLRASQVLTWMLGKQTRAQDEAMTWEHLQRTMEEHAQVNGIITGLSDPDYALWQQTLAEGQTYG